MGINDIHCAFFPKDLELQNSKNKIIKYKGGLTYIGKYILREEWEDRFYG